jgi:outer membrane protein
MGRRNSWHGRVCNARVARVGGTVVLLLITAVSRTKADEPRRDLNDCIEFALKNQPSLKAAQASVAAATQQVWQATSSYLPQLNANYLANRRMTSPTAATGFSGGLTAGTRTNTFNFYNTGFNLTQILFDFGQTLNQIQSAIAAEESVVANGITQREIVIFNVRQSYFNVLAAARLLGVADKTVLQNQQHVEQAQGRFDVGFAPKFDVTQAQVQLAQAQLTRVTARGNLQIARATLGNAIGLGRPPSFDLVDNFDAPPIHITEPEALARAYDHRPELQSLLAQQRSTEAQIAGLQKNYLPSVSGTASYYWAGSEYPLGQNWNVGANVSVSLFNGGLTTAQIGQAKADLATLQFNTEVQRQSIALEVQQAIYSLEEAAESIVAAEKALQQARENLELADGRYATGAGNIIEVTDAQTSLTSSEASRVQAVYNYKIAVASLERAMGQSVSPPPQ